MIKLFVFLLIYNFKINDNLIRLKKKKWYEDFILDKFNFLKVLFGNI